VVLVAAKKYAVSLGFSKHRTLSIIKGITDNSTTASSKLHLTTLTPRAKIFQKGGKRRLVVYFGMEGKRDQEGEGEANASDEDSLPDVE